MTKEPSPLRLVFRAEQSTMRCFADDPAINAVPDICPRRRSSTNSEGCP
jgi:hypothetical protein